MQKGIFATSLSCIDGRIQLPLHKFIQKNYEVHYIDTITEPGINKILAEGENIVTINSLYHKILLSLKTHQSKLVTITGHYDCAANPVAKELHIAQVLQAIANLQAWNLPGTPKIIGLWVDHDWQVVPIENPLQINGKRPLSI